MVLGHDGQDPRLCRQRNIIHLQLRRDRNGVEGPVNGRGRLDVSRRRFTARLVARLLTYALVLLDMVRHVPIAP